ncbi:MAG: GNAT family N-acetyltransferase [Dysgonamonadaceae bacterium]|jgi:ribosomal protein S18 acetylase RimI-like enzyme|nr:GNAT family N-acetyltransferase [Dysgonamonadaceae bacterium]
MNTKLFACDYTDTAHRKAVATLMNAYINDEMGGGKPLDENGQIRLVEGLEKHPKSVVILAETDGVFSGLLTAFENFATFSVCPMLNIHDIIVLKEYRGKGIGRKLMQAIAAEAEKRGCGRITLEVRVDNVNAQKLYRSEGFGEVEPNYYYWRKYL